MEPGCGLYLTATVVGTLKAVAGGASFRVCDAIGYEYDIERVADMELALSLVGHLVSVTGRAVVDETSRPCRILRGDIAALELPTSWTTRACPIRPTA